MTDSVDIILVSYNTRAELEACLESLHAAIPASVSSVTVVDNASTDGSAEAVQRRWPSVSVIPLERNLGFGAANNVAMRRSRATWLLLLNSDTVVPPGAIEALLERATARGAVAAGPRLVDGLGRPEISFGPMLTPFSEFAQRRRVRRVQRGGTRDLSWARRYVAEERLVDWVTGACLLVRRDAAEAAGFFDERFFLYEEDVDLCASLRARGGTILFTPAAEVVHLRGRSQVHGTEAEAPGTKTHGLHEGPSHYDRSHLAFYEKHAPGWAFWLRLWLRLRGRPIR